uniref:Reverse transcriptase zinc-binding domain-containing protein n=1 Tax=Oryza glumipatula TaxID=40148 RepID=A0A0D9Y8M9_9ORYZ
MVTVEWKWRWRGDNGKLVITVKRMHLLPSSELSGLLSRGNLAVITDYGAATDYLFPHHREQLLRTHTTSFPELKDEERISAVCVLCNGESILFWEDNWLEGSSIRCISPAVWASVPTRLRRRRTVAKALQDRRWIRDYTGALGLQAILHYLQLWSLLRSSVRLSDHPDSFIWKWEASGVYS